MLKLIIQTWFYFCDNLLVCNYLINEGAIELSILAEYYGREIAAYDIQTTRCDLYGQVSHSAIMLLSLRQIAQFSICPS